MNMIIKMMLFLLLLPVIIKAQDIYQSSPYNFTKDSIEHFLYSYGIEKPNKNKYIIYLPPGGCPRCEGLIGSFVNFMVAKKYIVRDDIFLIVDSPNELSARMYIKDQYFDITTVIYSNSERFFSYFSNNTNHLRVPYLYKINDQFEVLYFKPFLGMKLDEQFLKEIHEHTTVIPPEKKVPVEDRDDKTKTGSVMNDAHYPTLSFINDITLEQDEALGVIPSSSLSFHYDITTHKIFWLDELLSTIYVFDFNGKYLSQMKPSDKEFEAFSQIDVAPVFYEQLKKHLLKVIYLKLYHCTDSSVSIVSSLPKLEMTIQDEDTSIDYSNEICLVTKNIYTVNADIESIEFPEDLSEIGFSTKHAHLSFFDSVLVSPLYKGWPIIGTSDFDTLNYAVSYNLFIDSFYTYAPLFYSLNRKDGQIRVHGRLPEKAQQLKVGYYHYKPKFSWNPANQHLYFNDGFSPYFLVYDKNFNSIDTLYCFEAGDYFDKNRVQAPDDFPSPLAYLRYTRNFIGFDIIDVKAVSGHLLILYRGGNSILLSKYHIDNKKHNTFIISQYEQEADIPKLAISTKNDTAVIIKAVTTKFKSGISVSEPIVFSP